MAKKSKEEWKVRHNVFDQFTNRVLFKLSSKGLFDELESTVALGKEANVFTASKGDDTVCVKIYRLHTCDFNRLFEYITTDPRYDTLKNQRRKVIFAWTQREYRNLLKVREIGVSCPKPYGFLNNVLVMDLIGDTAPQVKDKPPKDPKKFYEELVKNMKLMWKNKFVHGDLSQYNILNDNETPVLIDFSQTTNSRNPKYKEYWERDVKNVSKYFKKLGVKTSEDILMKELK
jgi:RIO kinase 1